MDTKTQIGNHATKLRHAAEGLLTLMLVSLPLVTHAGSDPGVCSAYAQSAVSQNEENIRKGCGFTGPRWGSSYEGHYNWCIREGWMFDGFDFERRARDEAMAKCQPKEDVEDFCNSYARTAVSQHTENQQRQCGFTGDRWQSNFAAHFEWCKVADKGVVDSEQVARLNQLASCSAPPATTDDQVYCSQYARLAIAEYNDNIQRGCGFDGVDWHADYDGHLNWCLDGGREAADELHNSRLYALANCDNQKPDVGYQLYFDGKLVSGPDAAHYTLEQAQQNCAWNKKTKPNIGIICVYNGTQL